jgi:hypothetical protein
MKRRVLQTGLALMFLFFLTLQVFAQPKVAVKLNFKNGEGDFVGKRLVAYLEKGITASDTLKPAGEDSFMLIVDMITIKLKNRPSSAYSYIVTYNAYGKISPVLMHRLGICGNTRVQNASIAILEDLKSLAEQVRSKMKQQ